MLNNLRRVLSPLIFFLFRSKAEPSKNHTVEDTETGGIATLFPSRLYQPLGRDPRPTSYDQIGLEL